MSWAEVMDMTGEGCPLPGPGCHSLLDQQMPASTGPLLAGIGCETVSLEGDAVCDPSCRCEGRLPPGYGLHGVRDPWLCC